MTATFESSKYLTRCEPEDEVVISGISGLFPKCDNVGDLAKKLFQKVDLITDIEKNFSLGKINNMNKFDAEFFNINDEHADYMDPMCRLLLERAYEAIYDSGYNPFELRGTNTAVYVACCISEAEMEGIQRSDVQGAIICERAQSFLANRISYWLDIHGTSCVLNTACSSSIHALELAYKSIKLGECDAAIVGGSNVALSPDIIRSYKNLGISSTRCRSFDDNATGFCKSEAVCVIFIQRAKYARRIYTTVVNVKTNHDGYKKQSILCPSKDMQTKLINKVYTECSIEKSRISWVEAHGTGTRVGDDQEIKALETFCEGRSDPLLIGCVKSNLGHSEASSGLCSIIKVIISMETGFIPPNINYLKPQATNESLLKEKMKIVTGKLAYDSEYVAINNFGIGGSNGHVVLRSNRKVKQKQLITDDTIWLVPVSGRTPEALDCVFDYLDTHEIDPEFIKLLHDVHKTNIPNHQFRGYTLLSTSTEQQFRHIQNTDCSKQNDIWFVFAGMGSHWPTMAKDLMKIPPFRKSIEKSHCVLDQKNINLTKLIVENSADLTNNVLNCFIGIIAVEIALVDTLIALGITPNGLIGHSLGEIVCGYADGCLSREEALLAAYYRGYVSLNVENIKGLMVVVVGLTYKDLEQSVYNDIDIACYNSENSFTISGPEESVEKFITEMKSKNVSFIPVKSGNIAYHSRYIKNNALTYKNYLNQILKEPKARSPKWISSSVQDSRESYCDPNYFYDNFLLPVNFSKALKFIPKNAIVIEISPHSVCQSILKFSLPKSVMNIPITNKYSSNGTSFFLSAVGRIFENGVNMNVDVLYDAVNYPVCKGTAMLSPLIRWNHSKSWYVPYSKLDENHTKLVCEQIFTVSLASLDYQYLNGHNLNGTVVIPESLFLVMVWKSAAKIHNFKRNECYVHFQSVHFLKTVIIETDTSKFSVVIQKRSGNFEITSDTEIIVTGYIYLRAAKSNNVLRGSSDTNVVNVIDGDYYRSEDIYKELKLRGYKYKDVFCGLISVNSEGAIAKVKLQRNWVAYLNSLIQISLFREYSSNVSIVSHIASIIINPLKRKFNPKQPDIAVSAFASNDVIRSDDVYIKGIYTTSFKKRPPFVAPILQTFRFVPFENTSIFKYEEVVRCVLTILAENVNCSHISIVEGNITVGADINIKSLVSLINDEMRTIPSFTVDILNVRSFEVDNEEQLPSKQIGHLIISSNIINNGEKMDNLFGKIFGGGFLLTRESLSSHLPKSSNESSYIICASYRLPKEKMFLLRKKVHSQLPVMFEIPNNTDYSWISPLQNLLKTENCSEIILYAKDDPYSGVVGFFNCLRQELRHRKIRCFFLPNSKNSFEIDHDFYKIQSDKQLVMNVLEGNVWGCYIPFVFENTPILSLDYYAELTDSDISSIHWVQSTTYQSTEKLSDTDCVQIYYAGLSFGDICSPDYLECTFEEYTKSSLTSLISLEFSGKLNSGERVMGICKSGLMANKIPVEQCYLWPIPDSWSLEDSATVPFNYVVILRALLDYGKISTGQVLLINGAAINHFGSAAINVASYYGCILYTLENTRSESDAIESNFPSVRKSFAVEEGICLDFLNSNETDGRKIDLILNLTNTNHEILVTCINESGLYLQLEKKSSSIPPMIGQMILRGLRYQLIIIDKVFLDNAASINRLGNILHEHMKSGSVKSLPKKVFQPEQLKEASGYNDGPEKIIIQLRNENLDNTNSIIPALAFRKFSCFKNSSYIIFGGLGGMGFELSKWLVRKGAKKLILTSRIGLYDNYKRMHINAWRKNGINVVISTADITKEEEIATLLQEASSIGPVDVIFNTTLILRDSLFEHQTEQNFREVNSCKADATKLLDKLTREFCPMLRNFVAFSSISCGYGNSGQSNYGMANSAMERICEKRSNDKLRSVAIEWGVVADVGYLQNKNYLHYSEVIAPQPIESCLEVMDISLCTDFPVVSSFIMNDKRSINSNNETPNSIVNVIQKSTGKHINKLDHNSTLYELGLDSINIAEVIRILQQCFGISLSAKDAMKLKISDIKYISKYQKDISDGKSGDLKYVEKISILEKIYENFITSFKTNNTVTLESIVRLPSFLNNGSTVEVATTKERTLFVFPGVDGVASSMIPMASNIDQQVLCFQYGYNFQSVQDLVLSLLPEIKRRINPNDTCNILGYSYGGLIALEIASILERENIHCLLYLIDSSPKLVKSINNSLYSPIDFRTNIAVFIKTIHPAVSADELNRVLEGCSNWQEAINAALSLLPDQFRYKKEDLNTILAGVMKKHESISNYSSPILNKTLNCKAFLIRAKETILDVPDNYELENYFATPVEEFTIPGNHFTMLQSARLNYLVMNLHKRASSTDHIKI